MTNVSIDRAGRGPFDAALLDSMFRLRHDVFHSRLGWQVTIQDGREHDWFDVLGPYYVVAHDHGNPRRSVGCCRLLPTTGPNMLRDVFPFLADGATIPVQPDVWEISRFAVDSAHSCGAFGFGDVPAAMLRAVVEFAVRRRATALVGVTSAPLERMLRHLGFKVERLGRPRRIGNVMSLAFRLPLDDAVVRAVCAAEGSVSLRIAA